MTTEPKERPIVFRAPMVRAILEGRKTVTRRIVRPQGPPEADVRARCGTGYHYFTDSHAPSPAHFRVAGPVGVVRDLGGPAQIVSPYGSRGDHLWVKETWRPRIANGGGHIPDSSDVIVHYASDKSSLFFDEAKIPDAWTMPKASAFGLVPSIYMPRWASRLVLAVQDVRVERLHDITEEDIFAEGLDMNEAGTFYVDHGPDGIAEFEDPRTAFAFLWDSINGSRAPWESNPWVWRVEFSTHFVRQGST